MKTLGYIILDPPHTPLGLTAPYKTPDDKLIFGQTQEEAWGNLLASLTGDPLDVSEYVKKMKKLKEQYKIAPIGWSIQTKYKIKGLQVPIFEEDFSAKDRKKLNLARVYALEGKTVKFKTQYKYDTK